MTQMTAGKKKTVMPHSSKVRLEPTEKAFFRKVMKILNSERIPYLVGGAFALGWYTGIERRTKDFDIFVLYPDCLKILDLFSEKGYETGMTHPHWLGKILFRGFTVDVIYSSGNGIAAVDEHWFANAVPGTLFGIPVKFAPVEEIIYSKSFIMERERFDGADILHLILARGKEIDWHHLLARTTSHWRILLVHLILFEFAYPSERKKIPAWVIEFLLRRFRFEKKQGSPSRQRICYGTILSREQYLIDIVRWGFKDGRAAAPRTMTDKEIRLWTEAIQMEDHHASKDGMREGMNHGEKRGKTHRKLRK